MFKIGEHYKKLSFLQGFSLAICFTSIISIAATNLPGFFVFSSGTPISSSEINSNFEKIAGAIVLQASLSTTISTTDSTFIVPSDCPTCNVYRKKINFDTIAISDSNLKTANDNDNNFSSYGTPFKYYEVPSNGWYEIRYIPSLNATINSSTCNASNCSHNIFVNSAVFVADNLSSTVANGFNSIGYNSTSKSERDTNTDATFDEITNYGGMPPEIRRVYLKAGQIVYAKFEGSFNKTDVTATYTIGASTLDLTIIKL